MSLSVAQIEEFSAKIQLPEIDFPTGLSCECTDANPGVRVYDFKGGMVMWNMAYTVTAGHTFQLHQFPFDAHAIEFRLQQNSSRTWDLFDMTVCVVQFKKAALIMSEWSLQKPRVKKTNHKSSEIVLRVCRESGFYSQNVIGVMCCLSILGFTVFALSPDSLADRINTILTIILTAVAFKFAISDSMPKVGYNTLMDRFFLFNMAELFFICVLCTLEDLVRDVVDPLLEGTVFNLNRIAFSTSFLSFLMFNVYWICLARGSTEKAVKRYKVSAQKNWYSSVYATPAFIPPIESK